MKFDDYRYYIEQSENVSLYKVHNKDRVKFWAEHSNATEIDKDVYLYLLEKYKLKVST